MMNGDQALLEACPEYLSIGQMLKATPSSEGGRRFVYFEASNEGVDQQAEVIMAKALAESATSYERYGNVDIEHYTQIGAKLGIPDYPAYEIGRPVEVRQRGETTFVKSELYSAAVPGRSDSRMLEKANMVWESLTAIRPPQRWYPSVGGAVLSKSVQIGDGGVRKVMIDKVRWTNIGISKTPVNQHLRECAVIPMEAFAKSWGSGGLDITKALTAGYGTDSAAFTGGAALRQESLDGSPRSGRDGIKSYFELRDKLAGAVRTKAVGDNPNSAALVAYAMQNFDLSQDEAAEHVERFVRDLGKGLRKAS